MGIDILPTADGLSINKTESGKSTGADKSAVIGINLRKSSSNAVGARARQEDSAVMLSTFAALSGNSAKHLEAHAERPFAAAQGDKGIRSCCGSG
jgi:hypothetical protein